MGFSLGAVVGRCESEREKDGKLDLDTLAFALPLIQTFNLH